MVKTASLFSELLEQFPRHEFARLVNKHRAEYRAKGFSCWTQFVSMLFCQVPIRIRYAKSVMAWPVVWES